MLLTTETVVKGVVGYLDPGVGNLILQALIGGLLSMVVAFGICRRWIASKVRSLVHKEPK